MPIGLPEMPTNNPWQLLGQGLQQGAGIVNNLGEQQNALQAMVERRTQAALEQKRLEREAAQRDWEFQQKQDDEAKTDKARTKIADLLKNGAPGKDIVNIIPAETRNLVSPSSDIPQEMPTSIGAIAAPQLGYQTPSASVPQVSYPEQTITTPGESRPATMADYQSAILPVISPDAFVKTLTPPNKAAATSAARAYILSAKAAGNSVIKGSDLDQAALSGDPTGAILYDKDYINFKKTYATDAQAQNANSNTTKADAATKNAATGETNADTRKSQLTINQQNADSNRLRAMSSQKLASGNVISDDDKNYWAEQWAGGNADPKFIASQLSKRGGNSLQIMADITKKAQSIDPSVNFNQDAGDARSAIALKNKALISTIDNVKSRMSRLEELSNQVDRTRFPTLNKWILAGERGTGDASAELLSLNQDLMGEELSPVFGQGQAASDAKLKLAQDVSAIKELSPELAVKKLKELSAALDARKASITNQSGRYDKSGAPPRKPAIVPAHGKSSDPLGLGL